MSFEALLDSSVSIKRDSNTADEMGGFTTSLITLYRRVACRFETLTKKLEIMAYDKTAVYPDYYVYMKYHSGIKEGDYIYKGTRKFEIKLIEDWSEQGKYMKLAVVELKRGES